MSLEECKRLADAGRMKVIRRSRGVVDGEDVDVFFSTPPLPSANGLVMVLAYGEVSFKEFKQKDSAERYFEKLTQDYGLEEFKKHE